MRAVLKIRREPYYRRQAFEAGLKHVGFQLVDSMYPRAPDDWLVLWNKKRGPDERMANQWEADGGTVIVVENAYLQAIDKSFYAISVHGHNGSGWFPVGPEDRFTKIGIPMKAWNIRPVGGYRLVCGQRGIGSTLMHCPAPWVYNLVERYKKDRTPYRFRPHPGNWAPKIPLSHDLRGAEAVDIWTSAAGVQALVEGVPVKQHGPHWVCEGGGSSDEARKMALHKMSHGQWHFQEVTSGTPFARIIEQRGRAAW